MKIELTGKTALVTGSSAGIGRAIARGLAAAGARVFVNGRREATVQSAVQALRTELPGASIQGVAADVATATGCAALVRVMADVDILVNNAGIFEPKDFFQIEDSDWTRFFETNVMSGVRLSRAYLSGMLRLNWGCRVVWPSSPPARQSPSTAYCPDRPARTAWSPFFRRWPSRAASRPRYSLPSSSSSNVPPRCCSASPPWRKWRTWSYTSARRRHRPPTARRCAWKAGSSAPSRSADSARAHADQPLVHMQVEGDPDEHPHHRRDGIAREISRRRRRARRPVAPARGREHNHSPGQKRSEQQYVRQASSGKQVSER